MAALTNRETIAQAVAAYLLQRPYKIRVTGDSESVQQFSRSLEVLKIGFDKMTINQEGIQEEEKTNLLIAGIVGYLLDKGSVVKLTGPKDLIEQTVAALDQLKKLINGPLS